MRESFAARFERSADQRKVRGRTYVSWDVSPSVSLSQQHACPAAAAFGAAKRVRLWVARPQNSTRSLSPGASGRLWGTLLRVYLNFRPKRHRPLLYHLWSNRQKPPKPPNPQNQTKSDQFFQIDFGPQVSAQIVTVLIVV